MDIKVSINCITYNHEKYIADAIESFLMQKTNFKYEILIGEDCSTDNTKKIVSAYVEKYPDLIRLITSENNVGAMKNSQRLFENARGKYIALCEGDDFWIDPYKLQKQIDYMESNPECTICFHNAEVRDKNNAPIGKLHVPWSVHQRKYYYGKNYRYSAGEMALLDFIPTASIVFLKECLSSPPNWINNSIVGDTPLRLIASSKGYAFFIDEVMSVYRLGVNGSETARANIENMDKKKLIIRLKKHIEIIDNFNDYTNYQYANELNKAKVYWEVPLLLHTRQIDKLKNQKYKEYLNNLGFKGLTHLYLSYYFPKIHSNMANLKRKIRGIFIEDDLRDTNG